MIIRENPTSNVSFSSKKFIFLMAQALIIPQWIYNMISKDPD
jgi:hypothetical protein